MFNDALPAQSDHGRRAQRVLAEIEAAAGHAVVEVLVTADAGVDSRLTANADRIDATNL